MKYNWYLPKKVNFLLILCSTEIQKAQPNLFFGCFSFDFTFAVHLILIFSPHEMKYIWYLPKKVNFYFILYSTEIQKAQPNFFFGCFSFDLTFAVRLMGITFGVNIVCT